MSPAMELLRVENLVLIQTVTRLRAEVKTLKKSQRSKGNYLRQLKRQRDVLRLDRQRIFEIFVPEMAPRGSSFLEHAERMAA